MPFTHVEIEEHRTRRLILLFACISSLYVASIIALVWGVRLFLGFSVSLSVGQVLSIIGAALALALLHWMISIQRIVDRVLLSIRARNIDPADTYHKQFKNIVEEVSVAVGGRYRFEPYIISTPAVNACAVSDFNRRAALVVTEGLLARLSRSQLESVVGHEAAHVASGDSLFTSVFCGLFGLHEEALKELSGLFGGRAGFRLIRGRAAGLVVFLLVVLWVTNKLKRICEVMISREQEYRADAVAVRLTRNPISLAEALHILSKHWRGAGDQGESLSAIFIVDPGSGYLSEREAPAAEMFSTHPPTGRRIEALLGMAHMKPEELEKAIASRSGRKRARKLIRAESDKGAASAGLAETLTGIAQTPPGTGGARAVDTGKWLFWAGGAWTGPFVLDDLIKQDGLMPESWIRREGAKGAKPAFRDPEVLGALKRRCGQGMAKTQAAAYECPNCHISLTRISYEGVPIDKCPACKGCYVTTDQITRIMTREDYSFGDSIKRLAQAIPSVRSSERVAKEYGKRKHERLKDRSCPKCGAVVLRKFYTEAYLVEVEQCFSCGLTWLDRYELEILQYLYEQRKSKDHMFP